MSVTITRASSRSQRRSTYKRSISSGICLPPMCVVASRGQSSPTDDCFNTVLVEAQFRGGERFRWPTSLIHKISDDVRFAKAIDRPMYPSEWLLPSPGGTNTTVGGASGSGNGGGSGLGAAGRGTSGGKGQEGHTPATGGGGRRQQQQQHQQWVDGRLHASSP
jgi:hypothetical protein